MKPDKPRTIAEIRYLAVVRRAQQDTADTTAMLDHAHERHETCDRIRCALLDWFEGEVVRDEVDPILRVDDWGNAGTKRVRINIRFEVEACAPVYAQVWGDSLTEPRGHSGFTVWNSSTFNLFGDAILEAERMHDRWKTHEAADL